MANSYSVIDQITNEAMRLAHEKATFVSTIDRQYDSSFAKTGAKIGSSLRVRKPDQFSVTTGSRVMDVQEQAESYETVTIANQYHVDMYFTSDEMTLSLDELSKRKIAPAMAVLMSKVDSDALQTCTKAVWNLTGTAGTALGASADLSPIFNARAKINQGLAPMDGRSLQLDSIQMAGIVNGVKGLFQPTDQLKTAFAEGFYARTAMADFYENERVYAHANGSDHTSITVNDTVASGDSVITLAGASMSVGTVFTIADCYAVHPETKAAYSHLQQFVVTAVNGNDYSVSPSFISTGAKQNIDSLPGNSKTVTAVGSASTTYRNALMYHKEAFAFVTADLPLYGGADSCRRLTQDGISLRVWQDGDILNDRQLLRVDLLWGVKAIRPAWACRLIGAANS